MKKKDYITVVDKGVRIWWSYDWELFPSHRPNLLYTYKNSVIKRGGETYYGEPIDFITLVDPNIQPTQIWVSSSWVCTSQRRKRKAFVCIIMLLDLEVNFDDSVYYYKA